MNLQKAAVLTVMTAAETLGAVYWLTTWAEYDTIYSVAIIAVSVPLLAAFAIENTATTVYKSSKTNLFLALAFGGFEVLVWTQWAIIAKTGMWSATGIGPATIVFGGLLTGLHALHNYELYGHAAYVRSLVNGYWEAVVVSAAWVAVLDAQAVLAAVILFVGLGIEHTYRLTTE